jgi:glycosyltransferase involved in cell wall biosynthesis
MRVLFVSPLFPRNLSTSVHGVYQRMRMWLDAIQSMEADLDLLLFPPSGIPLGPETAAAVARSLAESWGIRADVTLCPREPEERPGGRLRDYLAAYVRPALGLSWHPGFRPYLGRRQQEAFALRLTRSPDTVFLDSLQAAGAARSVSLGRTRVLLDLDDVEHRRFAREVSQPPRWRLKPLLYMQVPALWWGERAAITRSDQVFVCSDLDRRYLGRTMGVRNLQVIPNAVTRKDHRPLTSEPNVLFIGAYNYPPNVVAAEYLIREVWPRLVSLCPQARLLIAGAHQETIRSRGEAPSGVEFLGFVPDLDALYRRTRVLCCPVQSGGGTRIKILEAASYGVPVVSTPLGAEGIDLAADKEIVLRSSAQGLAEACAGLLEDDVRARDIGASARDRTRDLYSRDAVVRRMCAILSADSGVERRHESTLIAR